MQMELLIKSQFGANLKNSDTKYRNKKVTFIINDVDTQISLDSNGKGQIRFEKSEPQIKYSVKIKTKGLLKNDQRLMFFY